MRPTIMILCLALVSWAVNAQHDHVKQGDEKKSDKDMPMFKDAKLGMAYRHYIRLKDALVASKSEEAKKGAAELQKVLEDAKGSEIAIEAASKIVSAPGLEEQRMLFSTLSNEMATLVTGGRLSTGMLYLEYCPMANNNKGAYWLSNEKEISNPYFGNKMLKCGTVKEMIP